MTLFLDRDGVINKRIIDGYVRSWDEFVFEDGVLEAIQILSQHFETIIVVTNQQGIGKRIMTEEDFSLISDKMKEELAKTGGRIDAVLHCSALRNEHSFCRKPSVGMGLKARRLYPQIRFKDSIMAGDSFSDMLFGKWLKMKTILIDDSPKLPRQYPRIINMRFNSLLQFAKYIRDEENM
ncbi:MAG: HAD-IIIA family hydrolase [Bacteroidales bacterium]|jgi:histidinol-phosphate phosphatase family protein|nr:HAD-IIIA family hydrolase [Bacteroidales bacterium]